MIYKHENIKQICKNTSETIQLLGYLISISNLNHTIFNHSKLQTKVLYYEIKIDKLSNYCLIKIIYLLADKKELLFTIVHPFKKK